jgi:O-antigen/teichoic acid export membrane protein
MTDKRKNKRKVLESIGWSSGSKFIRQFLQLIFQLLIARILSPEDFGIFSMVIVFSGLADILKGLGLGASLIKSNTHDKEILSSVFWLNVFAGIIIFILFQLSADQIALYFERDELKKIIQVFSLSYFISSINIVQESLLQKNLEFKRLFFIEFISVIFGGIIGIYLSMAGFGVWSLVWQFMVITISSTLLLWITSKWRPLYYINLGKIRHHFKFGSNLVGHDLLSYFSRNIDTFLIGKYLGANQLGIYARAYFLMLQPVSIINQVLARVMFPVLVKFENDLIGLKKYYLKSIEWLAFVMFPIVSFLLIMAKPLILVLLGSQWIESILIFQIFCFYSIIDCIGITSYWIYKSTGQTNKMFKWAIYQTIIITAAILIGIKWGILGVALSYTVFFIIFLWIPGWYYSFKIIELKLKEIFKILSRITFSTILTGITAYFIFHILLQKLQLLGQVCFMIIIWISLYYIYSLFINYKMIYKINNKVTELFHKWNYKKKI